MINPNGCSLLAPPTESCGFGTPCSTVRSPPPGIAPLSLSLSPLVDDIRFRFALSDVGLMAELQASTVLLPVHLLGKEL